MAFSRRARPLFAALLSAIASGCDAPQQLPSCGAIPEPAACPASAGGACADRACTAIYSCGESGWRLVERCMNAPSIDASANDAPGDEGPDAGDEATCASSTPPAANSCPSLQAPDCDAQLLDACPAQACTIGCEGFLRCQGDGWSAGYVAYCDQNGALHMNPAP